MIEAIAFALKGVAYRVTPLDAAEPAFRFEKLGGEPDVYDVRLTEFGWECDCRGFVAHGHCKHVKAVLEAGHIFEGVLNGG